MVLPVVVLLSACGGGAEEAGGTDAEAAAALYDAQPLHVRDATLMPEGSESGIYSELVTVQYSAQVRSTTELDKPECLDAANLWGELDGVQEAPASVAAYEWAQGSVSHMLVQLDEGTASEALAAKPPASCSAYTATHEDGTSSDYGVSDLTGIPEIGDESRAYAIEVSAADEDSSMYSIMYRNGGLVGTTSILGTGGVEDYQDMLVEFSEAAVERQNQMLG